MAGIAEWYLSYLRDLKRVVSAPQTGNLTRIKGSLDPKLAS